MRRRKRTVSIPQWAALVGMADDDRSLVVARALISQGDGPEVVQVHRLKTVYSPCQDDKAFKRPTRPATRSPPSDRAYQTLR
jgi:hypothetical protein